MDGKYLEFIDKLNIQFKNYCFLKNKKIFRVIMPMPIFMYNGHGMDYGWGGGCSGNHGY